MSFNNKTIEELHDLLVSKEISATELTQATLDDIKAREEAVNAFVTVAEEAALAQAKAIDEKGIDADNLLSGIPLAVKDNISTDGILTTAASKMLYNYEPIFDATAVANAKAKDMIVKTDKKRASYYNYYSNKKWGAAESYDICLDSSVLGREGTAEAIERLIEIKEREGDKKL